MRVYLCRHAHALPGDPDDLRRLSAEGRAQADALAARLAALPEPPAVVVSSPLVRARQTADIVAGTIGVDVHVADALGPGASPEGLRSALAGLPHPAATVGHQPDCSQIALAVSGRDPGFPPAGMAAIELDA
ncbi:MAG TPA: histidine phosphatase family protein [Gaiellaceae bacterium]|jgi:phosphohistidine phosphatase|nr:histidine phosphatase family protein [Gaiellaceae bacterium]